MNEILLTDSKKSRYGQPRLAGEGRMQILRMTALLAIFCGAPQVDQKSHFASFATQVQCSLITRCRAS